MNGAAIGLLSASAAIIVGISCAWLGFASNPYDGQDLGVFWGSVGAIVGITCGFLGAFAGKYRPWSGAGTPDSRCPGIR